jgi:hypothetical protein
MTHELCNLEDNLLNFLKTVLIQKHFKHWLQFMTTMTVTVNLVPETP